MLALNQHMPFYVALDPIDFRAGIDKLAALARQVSGRDPLDGTMFVFRNRSRDGLKILFFDGHGFWLFQRRFSTRKLEFWPQTEQDIPGIEALRLLLDGLDPRPAERTPWKAIGGRSHHKNTT